MSSTLRITRSESCLHERVRVAWRLLSERLKYSLLLVYAMGRVFVHQPAHSPLRNAIHDTTARQPPLTVVLQTTQSYGTMIASV